MASSKFKAWLHRQRASVRLAFLLQTGTRVLSSLLGLAWTRLLFDAMGAALNGLFLSFQAVAALGGLGDLGMGGAVAIRAGQMLGQDRAKELGEFLAAARTVFLALAVGLGLGFVALAPWLPGWLHFEGVEGAGSLTALFIIGAGAVALLMLTSYAGNLNYACGNVMWPVLPGFFIAQASLGGHWWLARQHAPLWLQYTPYVAAAAASLALLWFCVRMSHPPLARVFPLRLDPGAVGSLLEKSFWIYLCSLGNVIYFSIARLLINAGFGPEHVPAYQYNYKLCELAGFVIGAASLVSLPKITQWIASPAPADRARVLREAQRLNQFQTLLGCGAALAYLAVNDAFMRLWLGEAMLVPLAWQAAFAANLAITTSGDAGIQLCLRCGDRGLRVGGAAIGLTGLLNLGLSFAAMRNGSIAGIAAAAVVAQLGLSFVAGRHACRHLGLPWGSWWWRSWLLPVIALAVATGARWLWPPDSAAHGLALAGVYAAILLGAAGALGFRRAFVREEAEMFRSLFRR